MRAAVVIATLVTACGSSPRHAPVGSGTRTGTETETETGAETGTGTETETGTEAETGTGTGTETGPERPVAPPPLPGQPPPTAPTSLGTVVVADSDRCGLTLDSIYFLPNSAVIRNQDPVLDGLAEMFRCFYASGEITRWGVVGSADSHERQPVQISDERARTVARELVSRGVPADALAVQALGATQPVDPGQTADGQAKNRQVTFLVLVRKN